MSRFFSLFLAALLLSPRISSAQTIEELLIGTWDCKMETKRQGQVVSVYSDTRTFNGKRVSGVGTLFIPGSERRSTLLSKASFDARVRVRKGKVYANNMRVKRVEDKLDGRTAWVPNAGKSMSEGAVRGVFPAYPKFVSRDVVVWTIERTDLTYQCKRRKN
ncbi:hypothetical protein [uncultured Mameliella sp.]|uniref:hypothetical protein n=1 Tax=uncultured Mameliella sp. TaxID=1447087 RepID=UPI002624581C|nr:hypothetical protein [uncultured Mameliella sp.]